jgi:hypothetical protein
MIMCLSNAYFFVLAVFSRGGGVITTDAYVLFTFEEKEIFSDLEDSF